MPVPWSGASLPPAPTQSDELKWVQSTTREIQNCKVCSQLETLAQELVLKYEKQMASVLGEMSILKPLMDPPTSPASVITWITNFIESKITGPYNKLLAKKVELAVAYAGLLAAVASKTGELTCITNPTVMLDMATDLASWTVTQVGTAAITQIQNYGTNMYNMAVTSNAGLASMVKSAAGLASKFTANVSMFTNKLGGLDEGLSLSFIGAAAQSIVKMDSSGILANVGGVFSRVYTGAMDSPDILKDMMFEIDHTVPAESTMNIYLNGLKIVDSTPATSATGLYTPLVSASLESKYTGALENNITSIGLNNGFQS